MKSLAFFTMITVLFMVPAHSFSSDLGSLRIRWLSGDVQVRNEELDEWVPASLNMPLKEGDRIWVPEAGKLELHLIDGTFLRLDQESAIEILSLGRNSFHFYFNEGRAYVNFAGLKDNLLRIDTLVSSIQGMDRAVFGIEVSRSGHTDLSVYRGAVHIESKDGGKKIEAGQTLSLREDDYAELMPLGPADDWVRWNSERDRNLAERRPPSPYLPEELHAYSGDFEANGRWVYVREYGNVWTPTVIVSPGWAPYTIGKWVWIRGDYIWISYEPWGWVPYHYGRWVYVAPIGWCWTPPRRGAVYWGPGFVAWISTPTYVSWVPLAPGEIYYGRGYYGPHSVNITKVNITHINVRKVVYKNVHAPHGVNVVHRETFVKGRKVDFRLKDNPFLKERVSIGRPDIQPERTTRMPVFKEIPQAKKPPESIRQERATRPVFVKPETPRREMPVKPREGKPEQKVFKKPEELKPRGKEVDKLEGRPGVRGEEKPVEPRKIEKRIEKPSISKPKRDFGKTGDPGSREPYIEKPSIEKPAGPIKPEREKNQERSFKPAERERSAETRTLQRPNNQSTKPGNATKEMQRPRVY
jgi:hypothetical protein